MSTSKYDKANTTLGQFIREARLARGLSLEELAVPELSAHYIDALEREAVLPSRMALEIVALHFVVSVDEFLGFQARIQSEPDLEAIEEDLHLQLNYAQSLLDQRKIEDALRIISSIEQDTLPYIDGLSWRARFRIFYLRGTAYLRSGRLSDAQSQIEDAITHVGPDYDTVARVYNLLGVAHYLQGHLQEALKQHKVGLRAVEDGKLKDLTLKLSICRNLANAHWGLNNFNEAIRFYKESLRVLQDLNDVERQAGVYWGMMMAYRTLGNRAQAKLCGLKALEIYEASGDVSSVAYVCQNLAEINIDDGQYEDAQRLLNRAKDLLESTDELVLLSILYQGFARLAHAQQELDEAAEYAAKAKEFGYASCERTPGHEMQTRGAALRAYAEALHVAAQIEEARNNPEAADRLFQEAITTIEQTNFEETRSEIIQSYAQVLKERGEHKRAGEYYQMGIKSREGTSRSRVKA